MLGAQVMGLKSRPVGVSPACREEETVRWRETGERTVSDISAALVEPSTTFSSTTIPSASVAVRVSSSPAQSWWRDESLLSRDSARMSSDHLMKEEVRCFELCRHYEI